eukprot:16589-Heterococcus_DN1.PRE.2
MEVQLDDAAHTTFDEEALCLQLQVCPLRIAVAAVIQLALISTTSRCENKFKFLRQASSIIALKVRARY